MLPRPPLWPCTSQPKSSPLQVSELSTTNSLQLRATLIKVISPSLRKFMASDCQPVKSFRGPTSLSHYGAFLQGHLHSRAPLRSAEAFLVITSQLNFSLRPFLLSSPLHPCDLENILLTHKPQTQSLLPMETNLQQS